MFNASFKRLCYTVCIAAWLNFLVNWFVVFFIGGSAYYGRIVAGRYYLGTKSHRYTEVSQGVFTYSLIHARSIWITHPLAFITTFILILAADKKKEEKNAAA